MSKIEWYQAKTNDEYTLVARCAECKTPIRNYMDEKHVCCSSEYSLEKIIKGFCEVLNMQLLEGLRNERFDPAKWNEFSIKFKHDTNGNLMFIDASLVPVNVRER